MTQNADFPSWIPLLVDKAASFFHVVPDWSALSPYVLVLWAIIVFSLIALVAQVAVIFLVLMERKVLAWLTQRKGPNRVGPWGALQTLADGVKLLFKEDIIPAGANKFLFIIAPAVFFLPAFVFFGLIPFTDQLLAVPLPAGALFVFAISSISMLGLVLAGWASNNKYSLLGGMRSAAQAISYEIPLVMAVLAVVLFSGSMNIGEIVRAQQGPFWNWYSVLLTPLSLVIFFISSLAEVNRVPFDLPEAESELVSGYNTEYTGMKFALFFLAEYAALFAMSGLTVAFFMGGYFSPFGTFLTELISGQAHEAMTGFMQFGVQCEMLFWFMIKTYCFIFLAMWVRATLPRLKPDQLMGFSWKFLIPLSIINVFVVAIEKYLLLPGGQDVMTMLPILSMQTLPVWAGWFVVVSVIFLAFFFLMSRLLSAKLNARLARR
jgi:NADH-quinone oxidoreductase subunit H